MMLVRRAPRAPDGAPGRVAGSGAVSAVDAPSAKRVPGSGARSDDGRADFSASG